MFRTDLQPIIRSINTVFTAICICRTVYVDELLASSISTSLADRQSKLLVRQIPIAVNTVLRPLIMDSKSVRNM
jgi:hypothetical protein